MEKLFDIAQRYDCMETVSQMKKMVPEFISNHSVYSALDNKA